MTALASLTKSAATDREQFLSDFYAISSRAVHSSSGPYAYVVSPEQPDPEMTERLVKTLFDAGVEVQQATAGSEIVVLKGFAHCDLFHLQPDARVQYDLDLYSPDGAPKIARELQRLAAAPNYKWNGDFYDAAIPIEIDWHERLWDKKMEGFAAPGVEEFWARRVWTSVEGIRFQTLAPPDALAFAGLHMLKHVLHGEARPATILVILLDVYGHEVR